MNRVTQVTENKTVFLILNPLREQMLFALILAKANALTPPNVMRITRERPETA
jgi:hypothetical protein